MFTETEIRRIFKVPERYGPGEIIGGEWYFECFLDSMTVNVKEWKATEMLERYCMTDGHGWRTKKHPLRNEHMERQVLRTIQRQQRDTSIDF